MQRTWQHFPGHPGSVSLVALGFGNHSVDHGLDTTEHLTFPPPLFKSHSTQSRMASSYHSPASAFSSAAQQQHQDYYAGLPSSRGGNGLSDAESFASSTEPSPPRSHLDGGGPPRSHLDSPPQFQNAMDLVQRLQAQLKTVRLDKGRLEERCYLLEREREVNDISRNLKHHHPSTTPSASPLPTFSTAPPPTTATSARARDSHKYHHHHHHHELQQLEKALTEERAIGSDMQARLAKAEAQLKSRDKEVYSLQERLQKSQAALREAESNFLSDLSRLFKESAHPEEDVGERAKWERELGLALREVRRLKEEVADLRAAGEQGEEKQREGKGRGTTATTSTTTRPLTGEKRTTSRKSRSREEEKESAHLQEKVVRQAERIHADKKVIKLLKKALRRAQEQEGGLEDQLLASREAQKGLRVELASLAQRHEDLVNQLREQVEAMSAAQGLGEEGGVDEEEGEGLEEGWVLVDVERGGEEGVRRRRKKEKKEKGKKAGQKHDEKVVHHHYRRHHHHRHRKEEEEQQQEQQEAADGHHGRRRHRHHHHHHHQHEGKEEQEQQQQQQQSPPEVHRKSKTKKEKPRTSSLSTPPRAKPQAWEINFPPGKKEFELSPLIHRFETYEDGK